MKQIGREIAADWQRWETEFRRVHGVEPSEADRACHQKFRESLIGVNHPDEVRDSPTLKKHYRPGAG